MRNKTGYVSKSLWCIGLVIGIQILKKYLDHVLPGSLLFHHYLLTGLQLVVLLWTIIILLLPSVTFIKKLFILTGMMAFPELLCTFWLHHPSKIPAPLHSVFMRYSTQAENKIIQYVPGCSVYNDSLFYTLKPSARFVYDNAEFSDSFYINKKGLRDDDSSLQKPELICLGDSYAMGWGVQHNETFAELISRISHKKVLNAAISSYGTARELKNLYRLDTSNLKYIIIQYCRNDYEENKSFTENKYALHISSKIKFHSLVSDDYWSKRWFPGKRFVTLAKFYADKKMNPFLFPVKKPAADSAFFHVQEAARCFTDILLHSAINFNKVMVFVVDLNQKELMNNDFSDEINRLMNSPAYKDHFNNNLIMVPVADLLTKEDYYILDPHIRPSGHRKIAERLARFLVREN